MDLTESVIRQLEKEGYVVLNSKQASKMASVMEGVESSSKISTILLGRTSDFLESIEKKKPEKKKRVAKKAKKERTSKKKPAKRKGKKRASAKKKRGRPTSSEEPEEESEEIVVGEEEPIEEEEPSVGDEPEPLKEPPTPETKEISSADLKTKAQENLDRLDRLQAKVQVDLKAEAEKKAAMTAYTATTASVSTDYKGLIYKNQKTQKMLILESIVAGNRVNTKIAAAIEGNRISAFDVSSQAHWLIKGGFIKRVETGVYEATAKGVKLIKSLQKKA